MTARRELGMSVSSPSFDFWSFHLQRMSTTRMAIHYPDPISRETNRFWNQMVVTGDSFLGVRLLSAESVRVIGLAALPRLHQPPSGFLTLSAAYAHPYLVALFHATSTPRILVFRAFPSAPAAVSLDTRCSLVVTPACWFTGEPVPLSALALPRPPRPSLAGHSPEIPSCTSVLRQTSSSSIIRLASND
jgi:hypothetical protein